MRFSAILAALLLPCPALAAAFTNVSQGTDCVFASTFEGPGSTKVMFMSTDRSREEEFFTFNIFNDNWSLKQGDDPGTIIVKTDTKTFKTDLVQGINHGISVLIEESDMENLTGGSFIEVYRNGQKIDAVAFDRNDTAGFRSCVLYRHALTAEAKSKAEHDKAVNALPRDPFAH